MSDPWSGVAPAAVTSVVTTLVTLVVTSGVGGLRRKLGSKNQPILIRRGAGTSWKLKNMTRKSLVNLYSHAYDPDGNAIEQEGDNHWGPPDGVILGPGEELHLGVAPDGGSLSLYWATLRRNRVHSQLSVEVPLKREIDEYRPTPERLPYGGGGI